MLAADQWTVLVEAGGLWQHRNDSQIPPDTGTRFAIDELSQGPFVHYRVEAYYRLNNHHGLRLVYAPANIEVTGRFADPVDFNGVSFTNTEDLNIRYKFNSYRLSYVYGLRGFGAQQLNFGFTGKIRDAATTLSQSGTHSRYSNIGFVPLLYFAWETPLAESWVFNLSLDGAIAPQGRAIDAAVKVRRSLGEKVTMGLGLRSLEGGADNEKVFTFSWFNYALLEVLASF